MYGEYLSNISIPKQQDAVTGEFDAARQLVRESGSLSRRPGGPKHLAIICDYPDAVADGIEAGIAEIEAAIVLDDGGRRARVRVIVDEELQSCWRWWPDEESIWALDLGYDHEFNGCDGLKAELGSLREEEFPSARAVLDDARERAKDHHRSRMSIGLYARRFPGHGAPHRHCCHYCDIVLRAPYVLTRRWYRSIANVSVTVLFAGPKTPLVRLLWKGTLAQPVANALQLLYEPDATIVKNILDGETPEREAVLKVLRSVRFRRSQIADELWHSDDQQQAIASGLPRPRSAIKDLFTLSALLEDAAYWRTYKPGDERVLRRPTFPTSRGQVVGHFAILRKYEKGWREVLEPLGVTFIECSELASIVQERPSVTAFEMCVGDASRAIEQAGGRARRRAIAAEMGISDEALKKRLSRGSIGIKELRAPDSPSRNGDMVTAI